MFRYASTTIARATLAAVLLFTAVAAYASWDFGHEGRFYYEVTVTNVTKGTTITPIMVATTPRGESFFEPGHAASEAVEIMAETGNTGPLEESLDTFDVSNSGFLPPGQSVTQVVAANGRYRYLSIAAMLVPTNDTFIAVDNFLGPWPHFPATISVQAWDAGSETNDELCSSLPGPGCGTDPGPVEPAGEGHIHTASGIAGVGDLDAAALDFNNPVVRITVRRLARKP